MGSIRPIGDCDFALELMLDDAEDEQWIFRRDRSITMPLSAAIRRNAQGIRYLAPEIQLLYKARNMRPQDQADFERVASRLDEPAADWQPDAKDGASRQVHDAN